MLDFSLIAPSHSPAMLTLAVDGSALGRGALLTFFIVVCVLMVLAVLIQKPQGGGLAGAFGGNAAGSGQTAFGAKTGDALTLFTVGIFILFISVAIWLNFTMRESALSARETDTAKEGSNAPTDKPVTPTPGQTPATTSGPTNVPLTGSAPPALPAPVAPDATITTPTPAPTPIVMPADTGTKPIILPDPIVPKPQVTPTPVPAPTTPTPTTPTPTTPAPTQPK